ncbi:MAG: GNAT family N-acetyltransferase [Carnobacterium sp.]|uniref:GNAT family N-acetyltransferase n=1 Tax=Carnobacterium sp. TaxID=48221 RepID=UPI002FC6FDB2
MITFSQIDHPGRLVKECDLYQHFHNRQARFMYDYNFIRFKKMPTVQEFKVIEDQFKQFHAERKQEFIKFYWPENEPFPTDLEHYLQQENYEQGVLELFLLEPQDFKAGKLNSAVTVEFVDDGTFGDYLQLQYQQDIEISTAFASQKSQLHRTRFESKTTKQVIAYLKGEPVGAVDLIEGAATIEIDNFFVKTHYQKQGVGTKIQQFVMQQAEGKTVVLVADAEDTPREMYLKQNYQYNGFQLESLKDFTQTKK